jgi:hypothetical protein
MRFLLKIRIMLLTALIGIASSGLNFEIQAEILPQGTENLNNVVQLPQRPEKRRRKSKGLRQQQPQRQTSGDGTIIVTLLGTGGGPGGGGPNLITKKMNATTLVEAGGQQFLFDAGRGALLRLATLSP